MWGCVVGREKRKEGDVEMQGRRRPERRAASPPASRLARVAAAATTSRARPLSMIDITPSHRRRRHHPRTHAQPPAPSVTRPRRQTTRTSDPRNNERRAISCFERARARASAQHQQPEQQPHQQQPCRAAAPATTGTSPSSARRAGSSKSVRSRRFGLSLSPLSRSIDTSRELCRSALARSFSLSLHARAPSRSQEQQQQPVARV